MGSTLGLWAGRTMSGHRYQRFVIDQCGTTQFVWTTRQLPAIALVNAMLNSLVLRVQFSLLSIGSPKKKGKVVPGCQKRKERWFQDCVSNITTVIITIIVVTISIVITIIIITIIIITIIVVNIVIIITNIGSSSSSSRSSSSSSRSSSK